MPYLNGGQAVIATLRAHDVDTIFGLPGTTTLPIYDAMRSEPRLRHILGRHEQGVGFMADGYARITGRPGVACVTTGPGSTNIATPVANAYADSVPLLVISGGLPRSARGHLLGELHETKDQFAAIEALAGWARLVTLVEEIPDAVRDALRVLVSGRPRVAYLQIPLDLQSTVAEMEIPGPARVVPLHPSPTAIAATACLLHEAQRPLIVAGNGVTAARANEQLVRLAELLQAPVLLGRKSHDVLPTHHPLVITSTGYDLIPELLTFVRDCDAVLVVGSKLGSCRTDSRRLPLPPALAHIDIDPAAIGHAYPTSISILADARLALDALLEALHDLPHERCSQLDAISAVREALRTYTRERLGPSVAFLDALSAALPQKAIVVADLTVLGEASAGYLPVYNARSYIHAAEFCPIGCGLPLALGAKVAAPEHPVVTLCGDGGFLLNVAELATAVQERLDIVIIVFNDHAYTAVKEAQHRQLAGRYIASDLVGPNHVALAQAFGLKGVQVHHPDELQHAVSTALHNNGTTLIEVSLPPWPWF